MCEGTVRESLRCSMLFFAISLSVHALGLWAACRYLAFVASHTYRLVLASY